MPKTPFQNVTMNRAICFATLELYLLISSIYRHISFSILILAPEEQTPKELSRDVYNKQRVKEGQGVPCPQYGITISLRAAPMTESPRSTYSD